MECYEHGLITKRDTDNIELTWGNHKAMIAMLEKMAKREGFGDVLADGVKVAAQKIVKNASDFAMHVDGQELPMHNPSSNKATFPVYQVDATPARHTQGDDTKVVRNASGLCHFGAYVGNGPFLARCLSLVTGWDRLDAELQKIGQRIHTLRHAFNLREGINPKDRVVPGRVMGDPPSTGGTLAGMTIDAEGVLAAYVTRRGWDPDTFKPTTEKLRELGLDDVAEDLWD